MGQNMNRISGEVIAFMILFANFIFINLVIIGALSVVALIHKLFIKSLFKHSVQKVGIYVIGLYIVLFSIGLYLLFDLNIQEQILYPVVIENLIVGTIHLICHKKKFYI